MAQRRMFSMKIVDTDAFLDMPQSSQLLYFHLAMRADDDGFVSNPKKIMRMVGSQEDDYRVLISKRFILIFESGVCVIKHWRIHNLIRSDRYNATVYTEEMAQLSIKNNKSYTELPNVIPNGNQMEPQVRLGKVRLDIASKARIDKPMYEEPVIELDELGEPIETSKGFKLPKGFVARISKYYLQKFDIPETSGVFFGHKKVIDEMIKLCRDIPSIGEDPAKIEAELKGRINIAHQKCKQENWDMKLSTILRNWNKLNDWRTNK